MKSFLIINKMNSLRSAIKKSKKRKLPGKTRQYAFKRRWAMSRLRKAYGRWRTARNRNVARRRYIASGRRALNPKLIEVIVKLAAAALRKKK